MAILEVPATGKLRLEQYSFTHAPTTQDNRFLRRLQIDLHRWNVTFVLQHRHDASAHRPLSNRLTKNGAWEEGQHGHGRIQRFGVARSG